MNIDISTQFPLADCLHLNHPKQNQNDVTDGKENGAVSGGESDSASYMSEAEQIFITEKALRNVILPVELNESKSIINLVLTFVCYSTLLQNLEIFKDYIYPSKFMRTTPAIYVIA